MKKEILVVLIVCSFEESRYELDRKTIINLSDLITKDLPNSDFLVFDNGSTNMGNLNLLKNATVIKCQKNFGYWSALNWVISFYLKNYQNSYKYIYVVESDIIHSQLNIVNEGVNLLNLTPNINHIRTQKFSRFNKIYYDKKFSFLPPFVHDHANHVSYFNEVTKQKAVFKHVPRTKGFYYSNLHPKLPGLHRIDQMQKIFAILSLYRSFSELDFYQEAMKLSNEIFILSPGIWYTSASPRNKKIYTGSYSSASDLDQFGYFPTRISNIVAIDPTMIKVE